MDRETLKIAQEILLSGARAKKFYAKLGEALMEQKDINLNEAELLLYFADHENSESGAAKQRAVSKSLVSKGVDSLVKKGLAIIQQDKADRRCNKVVLQARGKALAEEIRELRKQFAAAVMKGITREQMAIVRDIIEMISRNIEDGLRQIKEGSGKGD